MNSKIESSVKYLHEGIKYLRGQMSKPEGPKSYLGVTKAAISAPTSYDDHPRQVKYGRCT